MKRRAPTPRFLSAALSAAAVLSLLAAAAFVRHTWALWTAPAVDFVAADVEMGEQLLHGVRLPFSYGVSGTMPLLTAWMAAASWHLSTEATRLSVLLIAWWRLALGFALGWLLGGPLGALLSALFTAGVLATHTTGSYPQTVYAVLVAAAAGMLVLRARKPTPANSLAAGAALGATLLFRSPLAFLPPLLAGAEWLLAPRKARPGWKVLVPLVVTPYLFLAPWIALNRGALRQFVPFEYKRADMNIVLGAMGLVPNADGDWKILVKDPPDADKSGAVVAWAAREIARHPGRYLLSIGARIAYVARTSTLVLVLLLLSAAAAVLRRRDPEFRTFSFILWYFLGIHCLFTVARDYMTPLWGLLAAAAAAGLARPLSSEPPPAPVRRAAGAALTASAAAFVLACLPVLWLVARWNSRVAARPDDWTLTLQEALKESPHDGWLLEKLGHEQLAAGKPGEAAALFSRAVAARPGDPRLVLSAAWSKALGGDAGDLLNLRPQHGLDQVGQLNLLFMQSYAYEKAHDARMAKVKAEEALREWMKSCDVVNRLETPVEKEVLAGMRPSPPLTAFLRRTLDELPPAAHESFLRRVAGMERADFMVDAYLELAQLAAARGDERALRASLAALDHARMLPPERKTFDALLAHGADRGVLKQAAPRRLQVMDSAGAVAEALKRGDAPKALSLLDRAAADARTDEERLALVRLRDHVDIQAAGGAAVLASLSKVLGAVEQRRPKDPAVWLERALLERDAGHRDQALSALSKAQTLSPDRAQRARMAAAYQDLKDYGSAEKLLRRLTAEEPKEPSAWHDLGVVEFLAGRAPAAAAAVEKAVALRPAEASYALTLGAIYRAQKRARAERAVYEAALEKAAPQDPLRPVLLKAKAEAGELR